MVLVLVIGIIPVVSAETIRTEHGKNYNDKLIGYDEENREIHVWTQVPDRITYDDKVYHDYNFQILDDQTPIGIGNDEVILRFESAGISAEIYPQTADFKLWKGGLIGERTPTLSSFSSTLKHSDPNGKVWSDYPQVPATYSIVDIPYGKQITLKQTYDDVVLKTIYDITNTNIKWTYEITNLSKPAAKFGIVNTCVDCGELSVDNEKFANGNWKKEQVENRDGTYKPIKIGGISFDTQNETHGALWEFHTVEGNTVFDFTFAKGVLPIGKTLVIDPSFSSTNPTEDGQIRETSNNNICDSSGTYAQDSTTTIAGILGLANTASSIDCGVVYVEYDISSIPDDDIEITDVDISIEFKSSFEDGLTDCDYVSIATQPSVASTATLWTDIWGGSDYVTADTSCDTNGIYSIDLGPNADASVQSHLAVDWWGYGITGNDLNDSTATLGQYAYLVAEENASFQEPRITIVYILTPPPDAVDDLTSPGQSYGTVELAWTEPELHGTNASGYKIWYTTPFGNPTTVLTNDTGDTTTSASVSGLSIGTDYTFMTSVRTEGGTNSTHPPATWLNVTTEGNFPLGSIVFNQTNTQVLPITFEEQNINSTAKFLNVTYANTYTMACDFHYKFANTNQTYTGLTSVAVSSTLDESSFIFTDFDNEIIDVYCWDTVSLEDADYILTQNDFPLLQQIQGFRNGDYGTSGSIGIFDFVTLAVVIISMIGLNRVNESVGAIFNIMLLGSLAWFEIIELPTVIFGLIALVLVFVVTSTRKT